MIQSLEIRKVKDAVFLLLSPWLSQRVQAYLLSVLRCRIAEWLRVCLGAHQSHPISATYHQWDLAQIN